MTWQVITADVLEGLARLPDESVQTVVTSPPYWGLRDYGVEGAIGLEPTPEIYVDRMVQVFREVRRVLRRDGTCWVNLGDSYANNHPNPNNDDDRWKKSGLAGIGSQKYRDTLKAGTAGTVPKATPGLKNKDLVGIPWRVAFALQADGWYLRSDVIWAKPNPMPESVTDRPTKAHEYVFLLTRSARYFYDADAVREPHLPVSLARIEKPLHHQHPDNVGVGIPPVDTERMGERFAHPNGRNMRSVWSIPTEPFPQAHFATFPKALVVPCIKAGTSEKGACPECGAAWVRQVEREPSDWAERRENGEPMRHGLDGAAAVGAGGFEGLKATTTGWKPSCSHDLDPVPCQVLDPFAGSGTVGVVALRYGRSFVGIELNPEYAEMARNRIRDDGPLFNVQSEAAEVQT